MKVKLFLCLFIGFIASNRLYGQTDLSFIGDVNNDSRADLVLVNTTYSGGAIRALDLLSGTNLFWINHGDFTGWMDDTDKMFLGDVNGDGKDDLVLVNTSYVGGAIRVIDISTGGNIAWINHGDFVGWMDNSDKMFLGDVNGDGKQDLLLVNTSYSGGAIRAIDIMTGGNLTWINHGDFVGWMDNTDKAFLADANGDNKEDLILVNTSYSYGAIRVLDLITGGNISWVNHGSFGSWMDPTDRMMIGDIDGDYKKDLILINTDYVGGAIKTVSLNNGTTINQINHGNLYGWMDACDRLFCKNVNGDNKDDIVFINTNYNSGAILALDVLSNGNLSWINHGSFTGWMDANDRMLMGEAYTSNKNDLVLINATINSGAIRTIDLMSNTNLLWINHNNVTPTLQNWLDGKQDATYCDGGNSPAEFNNPFVYIQNNKFYSYGSEVYLKTLNYQVNICTNDYSSYWIAPQHSYSSNNLGCCTNQTSGYAAICNDMQRIAGMGFNSIRLLGLNVYAKNNLNDDNLYFSGAIHPGTTSIDGFEKIYNTSFSTTHYALIQSVLDAAKLAGLKVILLSGGSYCHRDDIKDVYPSYLAQLSNYFKNNSTLMAYDFYNEPSNNWEILYDKATLCQRVESWYNAVKNYAPNHLTTMGLFDFTDVLYWDPSIMSVDFHSFHIYPDNTTNFASVQSHLKWISENITKPWIVGETGYSAYDVPTNYCGSTMPYSHYGLGSEAQQKTYASYSFTNTRACGAIGYSWWIFHDVYQQADNQPTPYDNANFQGLISRCDVVKQAADVFKIDGLDLPCCNCNKPADNDYYNYRTANYYTYGYIRNSVMAPMKDVTVRGRDIMGNLITTLTTATGYFKICSDQQLEYIEYSSLKTPRLVFDPSGNLSGDVGILVTGDPLVCNTHRVENTDNTTVNILNEINFDINVFPNPVQDIITIIAPKSCQLTEVQLSNSEGKSLYFSQQLEGDQLKLTNLNLPNGLYFLRIVHSCGVANKKIEVIR